MDLSTNDFLAKILQTQSPSGNEQKIAELFCDYLSGYCEQEIDDFANAICSFKNSTGPSIMLEAHSDEVGMQVTYISADGFIRCRRNGAVDNDILLGQEVIISGERGEITGVIGKKPIHLSRDEQGKAVLVEDLWIDIGTSNKQDTEKIVSIGDYVTYRPNYRIFNNRLISKGLDNKIGVYIIAETMRRLAKQSIHPNVFACAAAQEEVGCRGGQILANRIKPDYAICVDVGFATDYPGMDEQKYGRMVLGKGVVINYNCDCNPKLLKVAKEVASNANIPYQLYTFLSSSGGSDAATIQVSNQGVKTILLSIPCRYMHTPVEMCDINDVEACINLIEKMINTLKDAK